MKHLGDITKIDGGKITPVDIITGGSPCQDLSIAGKRAGLDGERSGLFMEQIRIIKEMRENERRNGRADESIRPRYMVWENVPGAFSSNNGEDFRIVLEETARVKDPSAVIPRPKGRWTHSGCILGNGWSIAWRLHDAQFWGVPQRRKRIALVADFNGQSAPEILFERKGVSGDLEQSGAQREGTTGDSKTGIEKSSVRILNPSDSQGNQVADSHGVYPTLRGCGGAGYQQGYTLVREPGDDFMNEPVLLDSNQTGTTVVFEGNGSRASHHGPGFQESDVMYTLNTVEQHGVAVLENHPNDSRVKVCEDNIFQTLSSRMGTGGGNTPMVMENAEAETGAE